MVKREKTRVIAARFPESLVEELEEIAREQHVDKSTVIVRALQQYIKNWKLERALRLYCEGKITLWKAAKIANVSLWEMLEAVKERKIPIQYTFEDFEEDFKAAQKENDCKVENPTRYILRFPTVYLGFPYELARIRE